MSEATWQGAMDQTAADTVASLAATSEYVAAYQTAAKTFLDGPGEDVTIDADDGPPNLQ